MPPLGRFLRHKMRFFRDDRNRKLAANKEEARKPWGLARLIAFRLVELTG